MISHEKDWDAHNPALNEWIGHDGQTAKKYHQKCIEQDKEKAIGGHSWGQSPKTPGDRIGQYVLARPDKDQPSGRSLREEIESTPQSNIAQGYSPCFRAFESVIGDPLANNVGHMRFIADIYEHDTSRSAVSGWVFSSTQ